MSVLIPILSGKENDFEFINKIAEKNNNIFLLLVLDSNPKFLGFEAKAMRIGTKVLEELKKELKSKNKECEEAIEWGETIQKISNIARLKKVDAIIIKNDFEKIEEFKIELKNSLINSKIKIVLF